MKTYYFNCERCGQREVLKSEFTRFITPALKQKLDEAEAVHHAVLSFGDHGCPKCSTPNHTHWADVDLHVFREPVPELKS